MTVTEEVAAPPRSPATVAGRDRFRRLRRARPLGAVLAGLALLVAFPPYGLWFLAPVGVALLALSVHGLRLRGGFGLGVVAGVVFFAPLLAWTNLHTGMVPWLLLSVFEALIVGLQGAAAAGLSPVVSRWRWTWAPLTGLLWVAQEALRDRAPFGGFPWGRLAFSQADSPLLRLAALGGAPLVTFAVGLLGGLLAVAVTARRVKPVLVALVVLALVFGGAWLTPLSTPSGRPVVVAVIQGSVPRLGLDFNAQRRAVLDNHVQATIKLALQVQNGQAQPPDLVVWPENSSDIDPTANPDAADQIDLAAAAINAPILIGTVVDPPGPGVENTAMVWQPDGRITGRYVKRHPVPFAEYIPLRGLARRVSDKVDLVPEDFKPGHRVGVLELGPAKVGDAICFEVAYDDLVRSTVVDGAQLITVQTNNATFNTAEAQQQLAMVRLRAVEHGRDALMSSTVGISAYADADGTVHDATGFDTQAELVRQLRLSDTTTLATRLGAGPEYTMVGLALAGLVGAAVVRRRRTAAVADSSDVAAHETMAGATGPAPVALNNPATGTGDIEEDV